MNPDRILKYRLVLARYGEMDGACWWNTKGILGRQGATVLQRGLPATHSFAQARVAFAVARARCEAVFSAPGSVTLWTLPASTEDRFETKWQEWLDEPERWTPFFERLASEGVDDLLGTLKELALLTDRDVEAVGRLKRSAQGNAVKVPTDGEADLLALLAAGFARGERGKLAVPYAYLDGQS